MSRKLRTITLLMLLSGLALATTWRQLSLTELLAAAEVAVHAVVDSTTVELVDGEPWTHVTFTVRAGLAWPSADDDPEELWQDPGSITLEFLGGAAGGVTLNADQVPSFEAGDEVILFAYTGRYYSPLVGFNQAAWWLTDGTWRGRDGRLLGLDASGELVLESDGVGADPEAVVAAVQAALEAR